MAGPATQWAGQAFGLTIRSAIDIPGLIRGRDGAGGRETVVDLASRAEIESDWPTGEARRISTKRSPDGCIATTIDAHEHHGYLFHARGLGRFRLSSGGTSIRCAPATVSSWLWQRYLIGQVLPFAALLQGLEPFHASAVVLRGKAVGFVGDQGAGKTTMAVNLHLGGAEFLTDDVLALESLGPDVIAHCGLGTTKLRLAAEHLVGNVSSHLPRVIGRDDSELRLRIATHPVPVPLAGLYLLDPQTGVDRPVIHRERAPAARVLFGSTFNFVVDAPRRLRNQLQVCSALSRNVPIFRATLPPQAGSETAALLRAHAHRELGV